MNFDDPLKPYETPREWTADHVMMRMIWAFEALGRVNMKIGPAGYGSGWPQYVHDFADQVAQETPAEGETESQAEMRRKGERRPIRLPPSAHELSMMEEALVWPARYLKVVKPQDNSIGFWAVCRARGRTVGDGLVLSAYWDATFIVECLKRDKVVVR